MKMKQEKKKWSVSGWRESAIRNPAWPGLTEKVVANQT